MCQCHRSFEYRGSCADHTTGGACLRARSFEEIVEVTQFIPHERSVDVFPVPQFRNKWWKS